MLTKWNCRATENLTSNHKEILELKSITKIENSLERFEGRPGQVEKRFSKLEIKTKA